MDAYNTSSFFMGIPASGGCADEAAQGTRHAEVSFAAVAHGERLGDPEMPLESVLDGLAEGWARFGVEWGVILDHFRRRSVDRAWRTLRLAERFRNHGVLGIGAAGDEAAPIEPFSPVYRAAHDAGLRLVHHAGEAGGPDNNRAAISAGRARRIGHGIRILDDPARAGVDASFASTAAKARLHSEIDGWLG